MASRESDWIGGTEVRRMTGLDPRTMARLAEQRLVTVLRLPGVPPKYERSSVEALIASSVIHALPRAQESGPTTA